MGVAQTGQILVLQRELRQAAHDLDQLGADQLHRVAQHQDVGVVGDVAAGRAQVDDALGIGAHVAVGVHVGHHVVAHALLVAAGRVVVDVVDVRLQLVHLRLGDGQAQLHLGLRQRHPQLAPGGELAVGREDVLHLFGCVAAVQGRLIGILQANSILSVTLPKPQRCRAGEIPRRGSMFTIFSE